MNNKDSEWASDNSTPDANLERIPEPTGWRLIVRPVSTAPVTKGGVVLPDSYLDREDFGQILGRIIKVGPVAFTRSDMGDKPWAKEGDWVLFGKYEGKRVMVDGVKYLILNDDNVIAVVPHVDAIAKL